MKSVSGKKYTQNDKLPQRKVDIFSVCPVYTEDPEAAAAAASSVASHIHCLFGDGKKGICNLKNDWTKDEITKLRKLEK